VGTSQLRFNFLTRKFLIKSFAKKFNPVIKSLDSLKMAAVHRAAHIRLFRSLLIFRLFVSVQHIRNIIHSSPFLPFFFYDFDMALLTI